jgi:hypothetical protein
VYTLALQRENGYLGGYVKTIDLYDKSTGLGLSCRSHGLSPSVPDLFTIGGEEIFFDKNATQSSSWRRFRVKRATHQAGISV